MKTKMPWPVVAICALLLLLLGAPSLFAMASGSPVLSRPYACPSPSAFVPGEVPAGLGSADLRKGEYVTAGAGRISSAPVLFATAANSAPMPAYDGVRDGLSSSDMSAEAQALRAAGAAYVNASNNARATKNAWDWERFSPCLSFADSRALLNADRAARAAVIEMHARYITALYRWQGVNQPGGTR